ncbi:MAG: HlyD family efflux transporter periplasmic adaptor subunit [Desulfuromonadaceae bacterium]|nr:HlyD family efflux transporter periplasmic adaptor subunit [Desulfuromonadaceae bacterium]
MSESLFSQSWYRVASLKPRLRSHVQIVPHTYRGQNWYVMQDRFTGRHHRFSAEAYQLIGLMDGRRTLAQIWETACTRLGDHMPTQDEAIGLLSHLFRCDLLQTCTLPDIGDLNKRHAQGRPGLLMSGLMSPLSVRFPLVDPDRFLAAVLPFMRFCFSCWGAALWLLTVGIATVAAVIHWPDLSGSFTDALLSLENLALVGLVYPLLKIIHEFGHALLVKHWGGEVHEMGVMLLVFMPIPYVDASSSLAFADKRRRMMVGAAGILIELFMAAVALLVWLNVSPGPVRAAAYNVMLIAGVSTLLFNGNPLLRFDAYYVLADFLEIPNLGQRSNRFLGYLLQRYLLAVGEAESPAETGKEAAWLLVYGVSSFAYRIFISIRIVLFVAGKFFFIGLLIAFWAAAVMVVAPLWRATFFLMKNTQMQRKRNRVVLVLGLPAFLLAGMFFFLPMPYHTLCEGITWAPEETRAYAAASGFITEILVENGSRVTAGVPLIRSVNPDLETQVRLLESRLAEYRVRYQMSLLGDRNEKAMMQEELGRLEAEYAHALQKREALLLRSPAEGFFFLPDPQDMVGNFVRRGTPVGYVLDREKIEIRVLVPQADIERVRLDTRGVEVRFAAAMDEVVPAAVVREVPAASRVLPSLAFSLEGGGNFALDPRERDQAQVLERLFQFVLKPEKIHSNRLEERVFVRFEHASEPLAWRLFRALRRLLLSRFSV